jgi:hypothetical protein
VQGCWQTPRCHRTLLARSTGKATKGWQQSTYFDSLNRTLGQYFDHTGFKLALFRRIRRGNRITDHRLGAQTICKLVKDQAAKLGLDPKQYGAHSMRAGFLTSAAAKGANLFKMMDVSRHKSVDTLRGYVRSADAFRDHAGAGLL